MPFTKVGPNRYRSPSGRIWSKRQVAKYYATKGFSTGHNKGNPTRKKRTRKDS